MIFRTARFARLMNAQDARGPEEKDHPSRRVPNQCFGRPRSMSQAKGTKMGPNKEPAVTLTVFIRYQLDPFKRDTFEAYARRWLTIIPRCGGELVGYWLPTKFAGPTNEALGLISFASLTAYEQYRERLAKDADNVEAIRRAEESGCILVEDRAILEPVS